MGADAHMPRHAWGDQKITFLSPFSLPTLFLLNWLLRASRLMKVWRVDGITDPAKCFFLPAEPSL